MSAGSRPHFGLTRAILAIALLPFLLVSLIAPGTMPVQTSGGFEMVICTGYGTETITVDANGAPVEQDGSPACDWAVRAQVAEVSPLVAPALSIVAYDADLPLPQALLRPALHRGPGLGARAPPLNA